MEDWSLGESQHHLREPIREVLEVQRQECEVEEQHECDAPEATEEQQRQATAPTRTKRDQRTPIDELVRGVAHDALCHCGDGTLDETITRQVMDGMEGMTTSGRIKRALGPHGKRRCKHCEAGWSRKQSTRSSGIVHKKTPPKREGTDISADVIGPVRKSVEGYTLMLIIVDLQTKYLYVRGLKEQRDMHVKFDEY